MSEARSSPIRDKGALGEGRKAVTGWSTAEADRLLSDRTDVRCGKGGATPRVITCGGLLIELTSIGHD
jgi:hypothetical protein